MKMRTCLLAGCMLCGFAALALAAAPARPGPAPAPAPAAPAVPAPFPAAAPAPAPAPAVAEAPKLEPGEERFVAPVTGKAKARVNVRVTPATDARLPLLGTLNRDEQVVVLGRVGKWLRISMPERMPLWVSAQFVALPAGGAFPASGTIKGDQVRLRAGGDLKYPALKELPRGAQVEVLGKVNDWLKVKAPPDVTAWVFGDAVELLGSVQALPPAPAQPPEPVAVVEPGKAPEPGKALEPGAPPEIKGPGVDIFAEAETALREGQAKEPPDYAPAYLLYRKALAVKDLPPAVRNTCSERLREIDAKLTDEQRKAILERQQTEFAETVKRLKEEAERLKAQLPVVEPAYTAKGLLSRTPDIPGMPARYKLTVSGVLLYYLEPVGPAVKLDPLVGKQVGVVGQKRFIPLWGTELIDVTEANQLGTHP